MWYNKPVNKGSRTPPTNGESENTMTKLELFKSIRNFVEIAADLPDEDRDLYIEGLDNEINLLIRKASTPRKPTKTQLENEGLKATIVEQLTAVDRPMTIKEMQESFEGFAELSNQRITHLLTDLRKAGMVARTYVKKVPYFAIGREEGIGEGE